MCKCDIKRFTSLRVNGKIDEVSIQVSSGRMIYTSYYYNTVFMYALQLPIPLTYFPATKAYPLPAHCTSVISCSPSTIHVSYLPTRGVFIIGAESALGGFGLHISLLRNVWLLFLSSLLIVWALAVSKSRNLPVNNEWLWITTISSST